MKFTLIPVLLCSLFFTHAQSPISLTSADMPPVGFSETFAVDTPLTSVNYGSPGANQVYDFSSLTNTHTLGLSYVAANTIPQHTSFPTANQALLSNGSYVYLDSTAAKLTAVGLQGYAYGLLTLTPLSPVEVLYEFPTQYQSTYYSNWTLYQGFTGNQVGQGSVDSVREIYSVKFSSLVDGWGKVITPVGSYRGLRIKQIDTIHVQIDAYYGLFGDSWHNVTSATYYVTEYSYVSKETKGALVSFNYKDTTGTIRDAQYSLVLPAPPVAGFSYTTGSVGLANFTDTSEGYPTRYHWNFGDGDTSNVADPNHTYATNGTYYVCETVYNPSGSNTICDSVYITNIVTHLPPVTVNDNVTDAENTTDVINVTANDNSPTGDPFCVTSIYGPDVSLFTVSGCNNLVFIPTTSFTGYDTVYYVACNTGQPTLCDTARVVVDVVSGHAPPVTVNDYATDVENQSDTINVTANDHSPTGDAFCVTAIYGPDVSLFATNGCNDLVFVPTAGFTGYDTVYYVACNTGQPNLCDTARVIVDVIGGHSPPVTVNDNVTDAENTTDVINVTANDNSPSGDAFCITGIYGPDQSLFTVNGCNNLIFVPTTNFTGYDTVYYIACNTGEPNLCDTAQVIVDVIGQEVAPVAVNDVLTILQPAFTSVNVTANDYSPSGDNFCITAVYPSSVFSIADCYDLVFSPDPTFTGNDTAWYVICNVNQPTLCDTASVIVTVSPNPALLPVVDFSVSTPACNGVIVTSEASNTDNLTWNFNDGTSSVYPQVNSVHYDVAGTALSVQVCLTATNTYGANTKCDTVNAVCDAGINEVQLSGIRMYPNPASSQLTIDMRDNANAVTKDYSAIEIYNAIGQKIITMNKANQADVVNVAVNQLAPGIYLATIVDGSGASSVLGKFTVIQ